MAGGDSIVIGFNLDTAGFRSVMRQAPRRAARLVFRVVKTNSMQAAAKAKRKLTQIQNPKRGPESGQRGGTAQGIHATRPKHHGSMIFSEVKWRNATVGPMLEWGPTRKTWPIRAKIAGALRFGWPDAPMGGFTATQAGSKGGQKVMVLTENTFYFKSVKHVDSPSHRRVHIKPAMEKQEPIFIRDLLRIPKEVLR